jgi:diadenosine tetraphosphatase ApaH/serine/threonine PP2A family protein phosphatase
MPPDCHFYEDESSDDVQDKKERIQDIIGDILVRLTSKESWKVQEHISVDKEDVKNICLTMMHRLYEDGPLLNIGKENEEFRIFGDIHGQYEDLVDILRITEQKKTQEEVKHLFLGDYVDRGTHSFEVCLALFCWKISFPDKVYLLRGNHEIGSINAKYGFLDELIWIYGKEDGKLVHSYFNSVFQYMPIAAVVHKKYFCVHGGLSKQLVNVESLNDLVFPIVVGPPGKCMINDMLWADPAQKNEVEYFLENVKRGPVYGSGAVEEFCSTNNLEKIIRGHQVAKEGYWTACNERLINIFSAPDYRRHNKAAVLSVTKSREQVVIFEKIDGELRACL